MVAWTAVGSASDFFTCWVADMGPYIGPDRVPHPAYLPTEANEVDYYVGVPNPGVALGDGGLFDALADSYTYNNGGSSHEDTLSGQGVDPSSARIYVAWYDPADPADPSDLTLPTVTPEGLVPPSLVAGGLGPIGVPSHWSDWQPGYTVSGDGIYVSPTPADGPAAYIRSAGVGIEKTNASRGGSDPFPFDPHDLRDMGTGIVPAARGATPAGGSLRGIAKASGSKLGQLGVAAFAPPDAAFYDWTANVELGQQAAQWQVPDLALGATEPAPLAGLGVTWEPRPDGSPGWDWEGSVPVHVRWADIPIIQTPTSENAGVFLQSGDYDPAAYTFAIPVEYFAAPGNLAQSDAWVDLTGAVKIGEATLNFGLTDGGAGPGHMTSTPSTYTLDLSAADFAEMTIVAQVKALRSGGGELFADVPEIPQTGAHNWLNSFTYDVLADTRVGPDQGEMFGNGGPGNGLITFTAQTPRWRYWVPGGLVYPAAVSGGYWGVRL